ncbi:MAG: DNA polymerase I [Candidatus Neomarinimicrobiota bacterium]|nr:DNA polymerase I [Candidatus Neomarinimicrobiota bacterium]
MTKNPKKLFIIDGMAIAYRAHFALIREPLVTSDGKHVSATYGFLNALFKILRDESPDYLAVAFDSREKTFRHTRYPAYKATREKMPLEMRPQIQWIKNILQAMNVPILEIPGYEADDVIGTLVQRAAGEDMLSYMVSGDKDFMQLVSDRIFLYAPATGNRPLTVYGVAEVKEKWGVEPAQIIDLLGLMGDSSDNVPGVKGIGEKTAVKFLSEYGTMENLLNAAGSIANARIREKILQDADAARLSRELVTIDTEVPLKVSWEDMRVRGDYRREPLREELRRLELYKFIRDLGLEEEGAKKENKSGEPQYILCDEDQKVRELCDELQKVKAISVDTETDGIDPMRAKLVGISLAAHPWKAAYIPYTPARLQILAELLTDPAIQKTGQHIKFDILVLRRHGVELQGALFDTMLAAYLLSPDMNSYKLDLLAERYLHYRMMPITELIGEKKSKQIPMSEVPNEKVAFYASEDADIALQLQRVFEEKLREAALEKVFHDIETPLIPVLTDMEYQGIYVDTAFLRKMSAGLGKSMTRLMEEIYDLAGGKFNINSPKQLGQILFEKLGLKAEKKTKTGYSTDVNVLEKLKNEHPLPQRILDFRMLSKLRSTYVDALPGLVNPETKRIHGSFNQTVAATGRLSSSNPNFQNIPIRTDEGREIRRAFCAQKKGWKILSADYSQVELRIMAHLSGDKNLIEAFRRDADIHAHTASRIFNVAEKEVTPAMRRTAKVINFGIMYGAGAHRIAQELNIGYGEAGAIIKAYFERYTGVGEYIERVILECREKGYASTMYGRIRPIPDINSENRNLQEAAKRAAINMPVQGSAADIIKIAMIRIHREMKKKKMRSMMILQVHDELVFELAPGEAADLRKIVKNAMEHATDLQVPLKVDMGEGNTWYDAH